MPDSYVSSMGSAVTETGYPPTADRDADRKLARLRTRFDPLVKVIDGDEFEIDMEKRFAVEADQEARFPHMLAGKGIK